MGIFVCVCVSELPVLLAMIADEQVADSVLSPMQN